MSWRNDVYQSIRMQLNVEHYKAIAVGRGANLDTIRCSFEQPPLAETAFCRVTPVG